MPMDQLLNFTASAPGKIILHGEHSVVFGKPALAATVGIRTHLNCHENDSGLIKVNFENLNVIFEISIDEVNVFIQDYKIEAVSQVEDIYTINTVTKFVDVFFNTTICDNSTKIAAYSLLFLLSKIFLTAEDSNIRKGFEMNLKSDLKIGAGLGSSASFSVCLAAAFLLLSRQIVINNNSSISVEDTDLISNWALRSEKITHTNPSGVDNTVCSFGNIIRFQKGENFKRLDLKLKLNILLVDSKVSRNTANLVLKVSEMKQQFPNITMAILNAMEEVVNEALVVYEDYMSNNVDNFNKIKHLFQINNDLLKALGVSHTKLEQIFTIASINGFSSKLTGAGGGGFALILLPDNYKNLPDYEKLCNELAENNFDFINTTIGEVGITLKLECSN